MLKYDCTLVEQPADLSMADIGDTRNTIRLRVIDVFDALTKRAARDGWTQDNLSEIYRHLFKKQSSKGMHLNPIRAVAYKDLCDCNDSQYFRAGGKGRFQPHHLDKLRDTILHDELKITPSDLPPLIEKKHPQSHLDLLDWAWRTITGLPPPNVSHWKNPSSEPCRYLAYPDLGVPRSFHPNIDLFLSHYFDSPVGDPPFGGRADELKILDDWLANEASPYFLLTAPGGRGKSALLLQWLLSIRQQSSGSEYWHLAFIPIDIRSGTYRPDIFLPGLAERLADILGDGTSPTASDNYTTLIKGRLQRIAVSGKKMLLVIDGLDATQHGRLDPQTILPSHLPPTLRVLLSARQQIDDIGSAGWLRRLGWDNLPNVKTLELDLLDESALADVVAKLGGAGDLFANEPSLITRLAELSLGVPIDVRLYIEALYQHARAGASIMRADLEKLQPGFASFFQFWLQQQRALWDAEEERINDDTEVHAVLSILAHAFGPLEMRELRSLVRILHPREGVRATYRVMEPLRRFVIGNGQPGHGYVLCHHKIGERLREEWYKLDTDKVQSAFLQWGRAHLKALNSSHSPLPPQNAYRYALQFLRSHFLQAQADVSLADWMEFVADGWRRAWEALDRGPRGFALDVEGAWQVARTNGLSPTVGQQWRCALVLSSIRSASCEIPGPLLVSALRAGVLSIPDAAFLAEQSSDDYASALTLAQLAEIAGDKSGQYHALQSTALRKAFGPNVNYRCPLTIIAPSLSFSRPHIDAAFDLLLRDQRLWFRIHAIEALAQYLSPAQLSIALATADSFSCTHDRVILIASIARHLPPARRFRLCDRALEDAKTIKDHLHCARALISLAPSLSQRQLTIALAIARSNDLWYGVQALEALVPRLSPQQLARVFAATIRNEWPFAPAIRVLASRLSPIQLSKARAVAQATISLNDWNARYQVPALSAIASHLEGSAQSQMFHQIIMLVRATRDPALIVATLEEITPNLPQSLIQTALAMAKGISLDDRGYCIRALALLAPRLSEMDRADLIFHPALAIQDDEGRARALTASTAFASSLSNRHRTELLSVGRTMRDESHRADLLASLSQYLSPDQLTEALAIATSIKSHEHRSHALVSLAPKLSARQLQFALAAAALPINDHIEQSVTLHRLAAHIPALERDAILNDSWAAAANAIDEEDRTALRLVCLIPDFSADRRASAVAPALDMIPSITDESDRTRALRLIAEHLTEQQLDKALFIANGIHDQSFRATSLRGLARYLTARQLNDAVTAAAATNDYESVYALYCLAKYQEADHRKATLDLALAATTTITDDQDRNKALMLLLPQFSRDQLDTIIPTILYQIPPVSYDCDCARALMALSPYLSTPQFLDKALALADTIQCQVLRQEALRSLETAPTTNRLAADLPERLFPQRTQTLDPANPAQKRRSPLFRSGPTHQARTLKKALAVTSATDDDQDRATALKTLAHYVSPTQYEDLLQAILRLAPRIHRIHTLSLISASIHISAALGGSDAITTIHRAIVDATRWYP